MMRFSVSLAACLCLLAPATAWASCGIGGPGARCLAAAERTPFPYSDGSILPRGEFQVLLNTEYYGLPPTDGSFWYFKVERRVLRVKPDTMEVLSDATGLLRRAF